MQHINDTSHQSIVDFLSGLERMHNRCVLYNYSTCDTPSIHLSRSQYYTTIQLSTLAIVGANALAARKMTLIPSLDGRSPQTCIMKTAIILACLLLSVLQIQARRGPHHPCGDVRRKNDQHHDHHHENHLMHDNEYVRFILLLCRAKPS